ncbi:MULTISPECIES: glycosyltransferase family 4 protein [unclassified Agarivorans]|uniref:glycosyltransferase family 4 protein n=1 Tax=unclassified Agarivorans TaxID=2636026 RepID=UPI0026E138A5|nr:MULTISPECIES: glycosyltransferase family 4 protein [unclassified Agarivorans]MDO6686115.1 glycosyltransferase family 4 protein [Agarivorans sp. 3_MG-2023]MDO6716436.1 glycosyltransferase family 4 protein [Agarivorans sp. 2_MG-2023]
MKILHVTETLVGGVETYLNTIIPYQVERYGSENIQVIAPKQHIAEDAPLKAYYQSFERPSRSLGSCANLAKLFKQAVIDFNPDVIHIHSTFAGVVCRIPGLISKRNQRKVVYCPHGWCFDGYTGVKAKVFSLIEKVLAYRVSSVINISHHDYQSALQQSIPEHKMVVFENALNDLELAKKSTTKQGMLKLLFVGRLDKQKGVDLLIDAIADVDSEVELHIAGASVVSNQQLNLSDGRVVQHGWCSQEQLRDLYASVDALVVPSRWEGFGLVVIEAFRQGLPVVVSDAGALPSLVTEGSTGYVFENSNSDALAKVICKLNRETLEAMSQQCREVFVSRFEAKRLNTQLNDLYAAE